MLAAAEDAASEASASKPEKSGSDGFVDAFGKTVKSGKEGVASAATALDPLVSSEKKGRKGAIAVGREIIAEKGVFGTVAGRRIEGSVDDVREWVISRSLRERENISSGKKRREREGRRSVLGVYSQEMFLEALRELI